MLTRSLIVYIINLWVSFGNKSNKRCKHAVDVISKLRLVSKEFTATIIPLIDWDEIEIKTENDMEILNKLFNPKPKLDRIYLSCIDENIVPKYRSWIIYLSETHANIVFEYPITGLLINKDRLKSLHWEYSTGKITDLDDITKNFLNLVELEINSDVIHNLNSLGQLEHLKMVSLKWGTCNIGSFIELLERKECTIETINLYNVNFTNATLMRKTKGHENQQEHYENILDALSRNSYLKTLSIFNCLHVAFDKQYLIQFLNGPLSNNC
ncbi:hypothetical protein DLAC_11722 [Tieghemostelium lacteum]|uniref:Uncharacterized protein n=1 Tax=Tieghemostelium lacteum TaxID=361077 RepID=A0A151Z802_TIELA|nr:hypothetical protein DLAC_11722 [Tieghemostelium lacteum]|eukprot:KYQ89914.1 hypothetical protein DLAC_11722 [Tieghemostelium lacteum]